MEMRRVNTKKAILGVVAAATCFASVADATIIYSTPGTTSVTTTVRDNIIVDGAGTTVNVGTGGTIRGVSDPNLGMFNAAARTRRGTLHVSGTGRIIADSGQDAINMTGNPSVVRLSNRATVIGDIVNEFTPPGWSSEATSPVRLYLEDRAGVIGDIRYAGYMRMEDNAWILGDIINPLSGNLNLDMRGGLVAGQLQMGDLNDYILNMSGGVILGGVRGDAGFMDLTMTGGTIFNGFHTGDFVTGAIHGGNIFGGVDITNVSPGPTSNLLIDGGRFNASAGDYLFSMSHERTGISTASASLDIYGGEFGYLEQGLGFFLDHWVDFSIYGWGLTFDGSILSGYLMDGSWFSNAFTFGSGWSGTFNINNVMAPMALTASLDGLSAATSLEAQSVPEPGTMGLLAACVVAMMMFGRRRLAASSILQRTY